MSFGYFHSHQDGNSKVTVRELDVLPAHEGEVKLIDTVHSGKTVFPATHSFTTLRTAKSKSTAESPRITVIQTKWFNKNLRISSWQQLAR